jgi:hypothetical protein
MNELAKRLPRRLCYGCGEQILAVQKQCPECCGCPCCGKGSGRRELQPTQFPMPNGVTAVVPFRCTRCGGCYECCACKGGPKL